MKQSVTEIALVEKLNEGNTAAFDELYFRYHKMVFANIYKLVKKQEEAEELLQDVFVALWHNRSKIDSHQALAGWLAVVGHNKAINHLQKNIKSILIEQNIDPIEIGDFSEMPDPALDLQLGLLNEAIGKLSPVKKQAFTLCKLEGKTYAQAASILNISPNTVKEHIVLATKFIKTYVAEQYAGPSLPAAVVIVALICQ